MLELFVTTLQSYGYRVLTESSGVNALRAWPSHRDQIDLLLTDIVMPGGVSGWELAKELQAEKPDLKVVYVSGHSTDFNNLDSGIRLLPKPFDSQTLAGAVRASLDEEEKLPEYAAGVLQS